MQQTFMHKTDGSAGHDYRELQLEDYGDESSQSDQQNFEVNIDDQMMDREDDGEEMM